MRRLVIVMLTVLSALMLAGCGGGAATPPTTVTVTAPPTSSSNASPAAQPPRQVTVPDVVGDNGRIAYDKFQELGFTNVDLASRDQGAKVVLNPANWTVTKVEPKAGSKVMSNRAVVVTMTKE